MGRHQHDIDELARMERICMELAGESRVPGESAALREMTGEGKQILTSVISAGG
jgi:hypothetical protein